MSAKAHFSVDNLCISTIIGPIPQMTGQLPLQHDDYISYYNNVIPN